MKFLSALRAWLSRRRLWLWAGKDWSLMLDIEPVAIVTASEPIHAVLIHGKTGQAVEQTVLPAGTRYTVEDRQGDLLLGGVVTTILVDGYRYQTWDLS